MRRLIKGLITVVFLLLVGAVSAQSVKGKITDDQGLGVPCASVVIDGTTTGTVSDLDGNFEIKGLTPGTYKLKISSGSAIVAITSSSLIIRTSPPSILKRVPP